MDLGIEIAEMVNEGFGREAILANHPDLKSKDLDCYFGPEDEPEEYDPLDDFNYVGSRHHY